MKREWGCGGVEKWFGCVWDICACQKVQYSEAVLSHWILLQARVANSALLLLFFAALTLSPSFLPLFPWIPIASFITLVTHLGFNTSCLITFPCMFSVLYISGETENSSVSLCYFILVSMGLRLLRVRTVRSLESLRSVVQQWDEPCLHCDQYLSAH